jgi:hypothetical protein
MGPLLISDASRWPRIEGTAQRDELLSWLRVNGITPDDVPVHAVLAVEAGADSAPVIRHSVYLGDAAGHRYLADPDNSDAGAAAEEGTTPLTVEPPMHAHGA